MSPGATWGRLESGKEQFTDHPLNGGGARAGGANNRETKSVCIGTGDTRNGATKSNTATGGGTQAGTGIGDGRVDHTELGEGA